MLVFWRRDGDRCAMMSEDAKTEGRSRMGRRGTTKSNGQKDALDRFYTDAGEAMRLMSAVTARGDDLRGKLVVEPSAGAGSFVRACEGLGLPVLAYDIAPSESPICDTRIRVADFLADVDLGRVQADAATDGLPVPQGMDDVVIVGNPPFGVQGRLALAFVGHASELASITWFVLPPTFRKASYQDRIRHAVVSDVIPMEVTEYDTPSGRIDVPSAFMRFSRVEDKPAPVPLSTLLASVPFSFCAADEAEFSVRRVGGNAGRASLATEGLSPQSNYFCKVTDDTDADEVVTCINSVTFAERDWTVGPRSVSKRELIEGYLSAHGNDGKGDD